MLLCIVDDLVDFDALQIVAMASMIGTDIAIWRTDPLACSKTTIDYADNQIPIVNLPPRRLNSALRDAREVFDVVLVWTENPSILICVSMWASSTQIPVILACERTLNAPSRPGVLGSANVAIRCGLFSLFDGFLTQGLLGRQYLLSLGVDNDRIACALRPINVEKWASKCASSRVDSIRLRQRLGNGLTLMSVSPAEDDDSPIIILHALSKVRLEYSQTRLICVSKTQCWPALRECADNLALGDILLLVPYVSKMQMAMYYGATDIFIYCPRRDTSRNFVQEAMACSRAVVASSTVASVSELLVQGRTGAIAYYGDISSVVRGLRLVIENGPRVLGESARKMVMCKDIGTAAMELEALISKVRGRGPRRLQLYRALRSELRNEYGRWWP